MQVVTFETAKRLKEAGFPQPEIYESGQLYYYDHPPSGAKILQTSNEAAYTRSESYRIAYAPTATELTPNCYAIVRHLGEWLCLHEVDLMDGITDGPGCFSNKNPAEAAAMAWLYKNEKK